MLKIEITDPQQLSEKTLLATAQYLMRLAGHELEIKTRAENIPVVEPEWGPINMEHVMTAENPEPVWKDVSNPQPAFNPFMPPIIEEEYIPPMPEAATAAPAVLRMGDNGPAFVDLDSQGLPWDGRIHTKLKTKVANGSWKLARGTDPKLAESVLAELKAAMSVGREQIAPPLMPPGVLLIPPAPPAAPTAPEMPPIPEGETFTTLVNKIHAAITAKKLTQAQMVKCINDTAKLPSLPLLASRPDLVPLVGTAIDALIAGATNA